ncbi:MAG TPA: serine/threonine-protein kinase [Polyangiaceae bacterium]
MAQPSSPVSQVRVVGRYALHDEIASGGMATVHVGRLLGPVGFSRTVAIKRLHPQFAKEPDFVSMFLDEARVAARIRHPNVVGTLDVVALDGELFLVMEYVQGESLARLLRPLRERGIGVPVSIAASIIVGALEGLHAAHEATSETGEPLGIVHRDVSPQNILVGTDGVARVVDFGVAKAAGRVQTTRDGQLKGKLGYMAPEQITGQATRATDIHAAAVVLWEMLAARRLYHGENDLQTYSNILAGNLSPPSQFAPGLPPELDRIVMRGLAANPHARFATAREMARAIQRAVLVAPAADVGDWVERLAGTNLGARARKVAAIESSGTLPSAASTPELDVGRSSLPPTQSPVSGERPRLPKRKIALIVPILVAMLSVGVAAALLAHALKSASLRHAPPVPAAFAATAPPEVVTAPPAAPSATATSEWTDSVVPAAAPEPAPPTPSIGAASSPPAAYNVTHPPPAWAPPPAQPQPQVQLGAPRPVQPTPPTPPAPRGKDFAHVMDSRK